MHFFVFRNIFDKDITSAFLNREREEQLKRENVQAITSATTYKGQMKSKDDDKPIIHEKESEIIHTITRKEQPTVITKVTTTSKESVMKQHIETKSQTTVSEKKFDVSRIRTDTLGNFDISDLEEPKEHKRFVPKDLNLKKTPEITKEQVKTVIDDILQKGTIVAASRSPVLDKDVKTITKDMVEIEKKSYDAKVPHMEERRHSCISPAISLERIAESDVEMDEEDDKFISNVVTETQKVTETKTTIKKSDSAMKQMADNIEIIIKQASEDVDLSFEEPLDEPTEQRDISGQVSVDSIIEEAITTVEGYLESSKDAKEKEIEVKKEIVFEETKKFVKERPGLIKSLSRDSGEIVIMPKKKHARTFSVQSSPDEVEEQIYTDSESGM